MPTIRKSHDLNLPDWGPYSKRYAGISHIPDVNRGLRFDLSIIPGHYRRQMLIPNEKWASGHHAWEASPDLNYYAYRYEIEWKDRVYCDVSFSSLGEQARLVRCNFVNQTDLTQNLMLHLVAYLNFPPVRPYSDEPVRQVDVVLPTSGRWVDALDYTSLQFANPRPTDNLTSDGMVRAEVRDHGLVNGGGIGQHFGRDRDDRVQFQLALTRPLPEAAFVVRYKLDSEKVGRFRLQGSIEQDLILAGDNPDSMGFSTLSLPIGLLGSGEHELTFVSLGGAGIVLDGFALAAADHVEQIGFRLHKWSPAPDILPGPAPCSLLLQYNDIHIVYGLAWNHPDFWLRQILHDELDSLLRYLVPNNYEEVVKGSGGGHFTDIFLRPIALSPQSEITIYGLVSAGSRGEVETALARFAQQLTGDHEAIYQRAHQQSVALVPLPTGEPFRFSQERMAATELMNVVYPVYTRRQFIRHNTPGKWWDCLYTWDSGFIGLAFLELDWQRAVDCLNAYLTEPGDTHAAFVHHGSPVPMQLYLFLEMWNRTQDRAFLESCYPSLRQYYLFLAGRLGSSTTRTLQSNLLRTWHYFFDSGGWDDYPAQLHVLKHYFQDGNIQENDIDIGAACSAITAHVIRNARILLAAAEELNLTADQELYKEDIAVFSDALQRYAWDSEAGYFSYVLHDDNGRPTGQLRYESGVNFNMGLDGVMPLVAGICTEDQAELIRQRLTDPARLWTRIGISAVDQSAPYYRKDGYWNGAIWFPHQWFIWKTALDLGWDDFAHQIAHTALNLWQAEVEASYYCFEHFLIESGRGAGWHQFGGLSSPVLSWYAAYYRPGQLTTGFDIWVEQHEFSQSDQAFSGRLRLAAAPRTVTVLVTLQPGPSYQAIWNGRHLPVRELHPGCLQLALPFTDEIGELSISAIVQDPKK
jgi:hypothetical protein